MRSEDHFGFNQRTRGQAVKGKEMYLIYATFFFFRVAQNSKVNQSALLSASTWAINDAMPQIKLGLL